MALAPAACGLWPIACGLWPMAGLWPVDACGLWPMAGLWPMDGPVAGGWAPKLLEPKRSWMWRETVKKS